MKKPRSTNAITYALYANVVLLAGILVVLMTRDSSPVLMPQALGQSQQPIAGGAGLFLMPGQFSSSTWGCYVMDVDTQTLMAYQYYPGDKTLRLIAARNFRFDRRLGNFNTVPEPLEVKTMLEKQDATERIIGAEEKAPVSPETPARQQ